MSLIYALVARQQSVLCEHTDRGTGGNFATITHAVLKHLLTERGVPARSVLSYEAYNFFFLNDAGLTYVCMAESSVHANVAFSMLTEMKTRFVEQYGDRGATAHAYSMTPFSTTIEALMKKYDNLKVDTPMTVVRQKMERVKMIMIENVNQLMERGEKIDLLVTRTDKLHQDALKYEKSATKLKNAYWWKNVKFMVCIFACLALLLFLVSFMNVMDKMDQWKDKQVDKVNKAAENAIDKVSNGVS